MRGYMVIPYTLYPVPINLEPMNLKTCDPRSLNMLNMEACIVTVPISHRYLEFKNQGLRFSPQVPGLVIFLAQATSSREEDMIVAGDS